MLNCDQFHLRALFNELDSTLTALDTACGISSELRYIPQTEILPGLNDLHAKGFVPMSYHLITARGGNRLMLNGQCRYTLYILEANCLFNTLKRAENIRPNIRLMRESAPPEFQEAINSTEYWAMKTVSHTQSALQIVKVMSGPLWPNILEDLVIHGSPPAGGNYGEYVY